MLLGKGRYCLSDFTSLLFYIKSVTLAAGIAHGHRCDTIQVISILDHHLKLSGPHIVFCYFNVSLFLINTGLRRQKKLGKENTLDYLLTSLILTVPM